MDLRRHPAPHHRPGRRGPLVHRGASTAPVSTVLPPRRLVPIRAHEHVGRPEPAPRRPPGPTSPPGRRPTRPRLSGRDEAGSGGTGELRSRSPAASVDLLDSLRERRGRRQRPIVLEEDLDPFETAPFEPPSMDCSLIDPALLERGSSVALNRPPLPLPRRRVACGRQPRRAVEPRWAPRRSPRTAAPTGTRSPRTVTTVVDEIAPRRRTGRAAARREKSAPRPWPLPLPLVDVRRPRRTWSRPSRPPMHRGPPQQARQRSQLGRHRLRLAPRRTGSPAAVATWPSGQPFRRHSRVGSAPVVQSRGISSSAAVEAPCIPIIGRSVGPSDAGVDDGDGSTIVATTSPIPGITHSCTAPNQPRPTASWPGAHVDGGAEPCRQVVTTSAAAPSFAVQVQRPGLARRPAGSRPPARRRVRGPTGPTSVRRPCRGRR